MGNRVILGTRGNDHGLFVSKEGHNVLNCARKELIFDSTSHRTGLVYAGAKGLSLSTTPDNFLTTGSKGNLGYIPLVIFTEKNMGERGQYSPGTDSSNYIDNISQWETTTSTVCPIEAQADPQDGTDTVSSMDHANPALGRTYADFNTAEEEAVNCAYFVLRIPCAYGYMTSANFG